MKTAYICYIRTTLVTGLVLLLFGLQTLRAETPECFMILAGKKASTDDSTLLAHNDDLPGHLAAKISKQPARTHPPGTMYNFSSGLSIPQAKSSAAMLVLHMARGYSEGDAIAINEHGVVIAGGVALGDDRNAKAQKADPLVKKGLTGGIRYLVLEGSQTALQAVQLLGQMYSTYGVSYPSGVGIADKHEVWYIEAGGGKHWAAVKIPADQVWVQANAYRIPTVDCTDQSRYLCSPGLVDFAKTHGLWQPSQGPFRFDRAFGGAKQKKPGKKYYDQRRVWRTLSLINPTLKLDPESFELPTSVLPAKKLTPQLLMSILRDDFRGTPYDAFGPRPSQERPIAIPNTVHTNVVQLKPDRPTEIGAVLWAGLGSPLVTTYVPFHLGVNQIPRAYNITSDLPDQKSAFWHFRKLMTLVFPYYHIYREQIAAQWEKHEEYLFSRQKEIESQALSLWSKNPAKARKLMTDFCQQCAQAAIFEAQEIYKMLHQDIAHKIQRWQADCAYGRCCQH
jgi:dipeptidase